MTRESDAALVADMLGGSRTAFDGLFLLHSGGVRRVVISILRSPEAADDLVQEVFFDLWRHGDRYACERGSLSTWLSSIARNRALDVLRTRASDERLVAAVGERTRTAASAPGPLEATIAGERAARLHAALALLPRPQREALILAYGAGLTHPQVAEAMGVPLGTAKGRLRLSKQQIARRLGRECLSEVPAEG